MPELYARLSAVGLKLQPEERDALSKVEYVVRKLQMKYKADDLGEIADQLAAASRPVAVQP